MVSARCCIDPIASAPTTAIIETIVASTASVVAINTARLTCAEIDTDRARGRTISLASCSSMALVSSRRLIAHSVLPSSAGVRSSCDFTLSPARASVSRLTR